MYIPFCGLCTAAETKEEKRLTKGLTLSCQHGRSNKCQLCTEWQQHTARAVARMGERLSFKQKSNILTAFQKRKGLTSQRLKLILVSTLSVMTHRPAESMTQISCVAFVSDSNFYCLNNTR